MLVRHWACGHLSRAAVADHSAIIAAMRTPNLRRVLPLAVALVAPVVLLAQERLAPGALPSAERPFGTLREQAALQQAWLKQRLDTFLPALMRKHGIDLWVVPMREYNEDPVFSVDRRARDVRGAAAHDLRVLRQVRGRGHAGAAVVHRADRARRHVAGRRVRGAHARTQAGRRPPSAAARPSSGATSSGSC